MASEGTVDSMSEAEVTDEEFLDDQTGEEVVNETSEDITNALADSKNGENQADQDTGEDAIEEAEGKEDDTDPTTEVSFDGEAEQENINSTADSSPEETEDSEALAEPDSEMAESENTDADTVVAAKGSQSEGTDSVEELTVNRIISARPVDEDIIKEETTKESQPPVFPGLHDYKGSRPHCDGLIRRVSWYTGGSFSYCARNYPGAKATTKNTARKRKKQWRKRRIRRFPGFVSLISLSKKMEERSNPKLRSQSVLPMQKQSNRSSRQKSIRYILKEKKKPRNFLIRKLKELRIQ